MHPVGGHFDSVINSPFYKTRAPVRLSLQVTQVDKIIKNTVTFTRKDIWNDFN